MVVVPVREEDLGESAVFGFEGGGEAGGPGWAALACVEKYARRTGAEQVGVGALKRELFVLDCLSREIIFHFCQPTYLATVTTHDPDDIGTDLLHIRELWKIGSHSDCLQSATERPAGKQWS